MFATVGGSGVGEHLLRRMMRPRPGGGSPATARIVVVTGPRIDPASLAAAPGVESAPSSPTCTPPGRLRPRRVQGGLTTCMELTAAKRPFLYFPLRNHFEQTSRPHRLDRYGAGRCMAYDDRRPEAIAAAIATEIHRPVDLLPVETDGAERAPA